MYCSDRFCFTNFPLDDLFNFDKAFRNIQFCTITLFNKDCCCCCYHMIQSFVLYGGHEMTSVWSLFSIFRIKYTYFFIARFSTYQFIYNWAHKLKLTCTFLFCSYDQWASVSEHCICGFKWIMLYIDHDFNFIFLQEKALRITSHHSFSYCWYLGFFLL